ncbi:MAG: 2-phosphosulfolactate phosphatase [Methanosphaera sp.]|nr:2-phosphosulfolactate phosphatase [Methanosphaera sp.]
MNIKVSLFNSTTDDLAVVIDQLRATTTITLALDNFSTVIPVNDIAKALELKDENTLLAGELNLNTLDGFELTNSPHQIRQYHADRLVLLTTNGTRVLENVKERNEEIKVLVGSMINANAVAKKALSLAEDEIELVMAGRRQSFNIEDALAAGIITAEIIKEAKKMEIDLTLDESAQAAMLLAQDHRKSQKLIYDSWGGCKLRKLGLEEDVKLCMQINRTDNVGIYENNKIRLMVD